MNKRAQLGFVLAAAVTLAAGTASAADAKKGKSVFNKCRACHALTAGNNKIGPTLFGLMGRKAGSEAGFRYSNAMKNAGEKQGIAWTPENLDKYMENPKKFIPQNKMAFAGLKKPADREDLIAYLKEATK